ncbi:ion transporter [Gammaproteobacteria bacterium]|jgi:voltage-gated sodium channel|nr:ion transporter [Gammaproteobacteria bacterium]|tara:strand:+ start:200 stop:898 length:699 start_codon:yes stop_codon:yes gene_type:complete
MTDFLQNIKENTYFKGSVITIIILSALLLGTSTYDMNDQAEKVLIFLDYFITVFFCLEISIRFAAEENKREFFKNGWNIFDTIIVIFSLVPAGESALLLRLLRIFRVLRLISFIPELRLLIEALVRSLSRLGYVCLLLFIILYIYAVFGSMAFSEIDPDRWRDLGMALITLVQVLTLSSWEQVMLPLQNQIAWAWIYFFSFIALGSITVLNLIIAVLVTVMTEIKVDDSKID